MWPTEDITKFLQGSPACKDALAQITAAEEEHESIRAAIAEDPKSYPADAYQFLTKADFMDALASVLARAGRSRHTKPTRAALSNTREKLISCIPTFAGPRGGITAHQDFCM
jgi:hypothetical protein